MNIPTQNCTGCTACLAVCPKQAISMFPNHDGFLCPLIDEAKCVNCGKCERICPLNWFQKNPTPLLCLAAKTYDDSLLKVSSSGGVFSELAIPVLKSGGCVFGVVFDGFKAKHSMAENLDGLALMRGAKYVQSEIGDALQGCRRQVRSGRRVLFSGTPCQIAGLQALLGDEANRQNLLTVAIICHGVASPLALQTYIKEEEKRLSCKVVSINFRDKLAIHGDIALSIKTRKNEKVSYIRRSPYMRAFIQAYCNRESCFACKFRGGASGADIVIGDFWGIEKLSNKFDVKKGISAVIAFTEKGRLAIDALNIDRLFVSYEDIAEKNYNLNRNSIRPRKYASFMRMVRHGGAFYRFFDCLDKPTLRMLAIQTVKKALRPLYHRLRGGTK